MTLFKIIGSTALSVLLLTGCGSNTDSSTNSGLTTSPNVNQTTSTVNVVQSQEVSKLGNYASLLTASSPRRASALNNSSSTNTRLNELKVQIATNP